MHSNALKQVQRNDTTLVVCCPCCPLGHVVQVKKRTIVNDVHYPYLFESTAPTKTTNKALRAKLGCLLQQNWVWLKMLPVWTYNVTTSFDDWKLSFFIAPKYQQRPPKNSDLKPRLKGLIFSSFPRLVLYCQGIFFPPPLHLPYSRLNGSNIQGAGFPGKCC